jgi:hypothetical protein
VFTTGARSLDLMTRSRCGAVILRLLFGYIAAARGTAYRQPARKKLHAERIHVLPVGIGADQFWSHNRSMGIPVARYLLSWPSEQRRQRVKSLQLRRPLLLRH